MHRQEHNLAGVASLPQFERNVDPAHLSDTYVEDYEIRMQPLRFGNDHFTVGDQGNDFIVDTERSCNMAEYCRIIIRQ